MQVVGEDVSHTPSLWICGCSSNYFQQSVKEVKGVLEEPVGSKATGKEEKGMKPHVCRCSLVKNTVKRSGKGGIIGLELAADVQATALGAPANSWEQTPTQQSGELKEKK